MSATTIQSQQQNLSPQALKALEQSRQRLSQLTNSLATLQRDILTSDPLPAWPALSSLSSVIAQNLSALSTIHSEHSTLLSSLAVYPDPATYPPNNHGGRSIPEGLLEQLLRKKLEPRVEDWVESGRKMAGPGQEGYQQAGSNGEGLRGLWEWAAPAANAEARRHAWGADYTRADVEGEGGVEMVKTGLRRKLKVPGFGGGDDEEEDDDNDNEDDDEDEDGDGDVVMDGENGDIAEPIARVDVRRKINGGGVELDIIGGVGSEEDGRGGEKPLALAAHMRYLMTGSLP